ncbi:MAG: DsbA family protein [Longimicrobiales bacterium]|nr:DsbA family protein [Longimicrobiales bacterium]
MPTLELHLDYIDPASWVMHRRLLQATTPDGELAGTLLRCHPREVRPPELPPLDPTSGSWRRHVESILRVAPGEMESYRPPARLPHTRKAHELALHAEAGGSRNAIDSAIFRAVLVEGRDVGRIDVLVEIAESLGFDRTETRAVLDVDRYTDRVVQLRAASASPGVVGVPTMVFDGSLLEGVHSVEAVRAWMTPEATESN